MTDGEGMPTEAEWLEGLPEDQDDDEWDYPDGYSRSDLLFGGNFCSEHNYQRTSQVPTGQP